MATFVSHKKLPAHHKNRALENVAEEVLNGMFCHYEPPGPQSNNKIRGILRRPGKVNPARRTAGASQRVRWIDEESEKRKAMDPPVNNDPPPTYCIRQACFDASIEAGCVSDPNKRSTGQTIKKTKQMDAKEAIAIAMAKSPRNVLLKQGTELLFDEDGNLAFADPKKMGVPPPPPPPPPPRERELFLPQFCGAHFKCDDRDDTTGGGNTTEGPALRALASLSSEEEDNSLIDEGTFDEAMSLDQGGNRELSQKNDKAPKIKNSPTKVDVIGYSKDGRESSEGDWAVVSPASSLFRRVFSRRQSDSSEPISEQVVTLREIVSTSSDEDEKNNHPSTKQNRPRSSSPVRKQVGSLINPLPLIRSDSAKLRMKAGVKFLKGLSPRSKKRVPDSSDWDDSIPIVPPSLSDTQSPRGRSRSRSASPSMRRRTRIVPVVDKIDRSLYVQNRRNDTVTHTQPLPTHGPSFTHQPLSNLHPAHPLHYLTPNNPIGMLGDDMDERESFITAHRIGFDGNAIAQHSMNPFRAAPPSLQDDNSDRESFITAHRDGFEASKERPVFCQNQKNAMEQRNLTEAHYSDCAGNISIAKDDDVERQNFVTSLRHGYAPDATMKGGPPLTHIEMLEQMRIRQENEVAAINLATSLVPNKSLGNRRSRSPTRRSSLSPSRRNRSSLDNVVPVPSQMIGPVMVFDPRLGAAVPMYYSQDASPIFLTENYSPVPLPVQGQTTALTLHTSTSQQGAPTDIYNSSAQHILTPGQQHNVRETTEQNGLALHDEPQELSWEERTRLAWERIRGGVEAALNFEAVKDETGDKSTIENQPTQTTLTETVDLLPNQSSPTKMSPFNSNAHLQYSPHSLVQTPSNESKRVTFGEAQERIFYDAQDENRSEATHSGLDCRKKKKRFRGTKLVNAILGKFRNKHQEKFDLVPAKSTESTIQSVGSTYSFGSEYEHSAYGTKSSPVYSSPSHSTTYQTYSDPRLGPSVMVMND